MPKGEVQGVGEGRGGVGEEVACPEGLAGPHSVTSPRTESGWPRSSPHPPMLSLKHPSGLSVLAISPSLLPAAGLCTC